MSVTSRTAHNSTTRLKHKHLILSHSLVAAAGFSLLLFGTAFKAMALGDVPEGDRRDLKNALRTATQSRLPLRQLPPQAW